MKVRLSASARRDLDGIWTYTAERWSKAQADRYLRQIAQSFGDLGSGRAKGRDIDGIRSGYLKLVVGSHLLFYRMNEDGIEVVRILHRRMDVERHL